MALPVLSANSPAAGSIAWTTFSIAYAGVQRTIPAGNTTKRYVYWLWNNGAPAAAVQTADTLPTNLTADDLVLFVNRNGVPVNVQSANVIEGSIIATESIIGDSIQGNTIEGVKMKADTLTAREVAANSLTINELSVSTWGGTFALNGDMEDVDPATKVPAGWSAGFERSGSAPLYSQETMQPLSGSTSMAIMVAANSVEGVASKAVPVKAGDLIRFGTAFRTSVTGVPITLRAYFSATPDFTAAQAISGTPELPENVYIFDVSGAGLAPRDDLPNPLAGPGISAMLDGWKTPVTTPLYVSGQFRVPAGARFMRFMLASGLTSNSPSHTAIWDALDADSVVTGVRIADGAIDGMKITGAVIQTAENGARWILSGDGVGTAARQWLRAYSGMLDETAPGGLESAVQALDPSGNSGTTGALRMSAPTRSSTAGLVQSSLTLFSGGSVMVAGGDAGGYSDPEATLESTAIRLDADSSVFIAAGSRSFYNPADPSKKGASVFVDRGGRLGASGDVEVYLTAGANGYGTADPTLSLKSDRAVLSKGSSSRTVMGNYIEDIAAGGGRLSLRANGEAALAANGGRELLLRSDAAWINRGDSGGGFCIGDYETVAGEPSLRLHRTVSNVNRRSYFYITGGGTASWLYQENGSTQNRIELLADQTFIMDAIACAPMRPKDTGTINYVHTTTSTTEVDNTGGPSLTFTAPPSGVVKFLVSCYPKAGADGKLAEVGIRIRSGGTIGSGTQVGFEYIASSYVGQYNRIAGFATVTGLTPGATYNARLTLRTNDAAYAASNSQSRILVEACM